MKVVFAFILKHSKKGLGSCCAVTFEFSVTGSKDELSWFMCLTVSFSRNTKVCLFACENIQSQVFYI